MNGAIRSNGRTIPRVAGRKADEHAPFAAVGGRVLETPPGPTPERNTPHALPFTFGKWPEHLRPHPSPFPYCGLAEWRGNRRAHPCHFNFGYNFLVPPDTDVLAILRSLQKLNGFGPESATNVTFRSLTPSVVL